jgi:hypothetical protein
MRYAGMRAYNSGGGLVLVYVIEPGDFQHWLGVEEIMRAEAMEEAEATLAKASEKMRQIIGIDPEVVIRQGKTTEEIHAVIEEDQDIAILFGQGWPRSAGGVHRRPRRRVSDSGHSHPRRALR